jgi:hypothetical protein
MKFKVMSKVFGLVMFAILSALKLSTAALAQAPSYSVRPIPLPPGATGPHTGSVNNQGLIALYAKLPNGFEPYVGTPSTSAALAFPSGLAAFTNANFALNDSGQVAGFGFNASNNYQGFFDAFAVPNPAGLLEGEILAMNNFGVVAGTASDNFSFDPVFAFVGSTLIPATADFTPFAATGVNDTGTVVGTGNPTATPGVSQAFYYAGSVLTPIALPPQWGFSAAVAINSSGLVLCSGKAGNFAQEAFLFDISSGNQTIIPVPAGWQSLGPLALNDAGQVVGLVIASGGQSTSAFLWDSVNGTRLLNSLVPSGWNITKATGINNSGQIAAEAQSTADGVSVAVRLDPPQCAQPPSLSGFNGGAGFAANGGPLFNGNSLIITDNHLFEARSVFSCAQQDVSAFTAGFTYSAKLGIPQFADGITFVIHNDRAGVNALGAIGGRPRVCRTRWRARRHFPQRGPRVQCLRRPCPGDSGSH